MPFANPTQPPQIQPPTLSLIRSSRPVPDDTNGRWINGFSFQPLPAYAGWTDDPCQPSGTRSDDITAAHPGTISPGPGSETWTPGLHRTSDRCSSFGYQVHDYVARATLAMEVATFGLVETEFWTGAQAQLSGWGNGAAGASYDGKNLWLASAHATVITGGTTPSVMGAIQILEQAIASCGSGGRGMIHCTVGAQPQLPNVRREGDLLLTARDTIVVPGVGYPGTGPGGSAPPAGKTWMYATGLTDVRLADIEIVPRPADYPSLDAFIAASMDRSTNDVIVRAMRYGAANWDGQCHFATLATLST